MALMKQNHFRQPEKTEQDMNNQNIDENPYAPPKSALDFGQTEKGSKKQRIARVLLGAVCVSFLISITTFFFNILNNPKFNPLEVGYWGSTILIGVMSLLFILPSIVLSFILEYFCFSWIRKITVALVLGSGVMYSLYLITNKTVSGSTITDCISVIFSTITAVFIMQAHQKHYQRKRLPSQTL